VKHYTSSLSDLKEIGCKLTCPVHISPLFWAIERLLPCKIVKICPRPSQFCEQPLLGLPAYPASLRFFKSDRLLEIGRIAAIGCGMNCSAYIPLRVRRIRETYRSKRSECGKLRASYLFLRF